VGPLESGLLEDVHVTADVRTNMLIISAPPKTMELILRLVADLDVVAAAKAQINIFTLKKADAVLTANLLIQLFLSSAPTASTTGGGGGAGTTIRPPGATGGGGGGLGGGLSGASQAGGVRPLLSISGDPSPGATLINLNISVDERTNSIIVAGSQNDLDTISAIIDRLESTDIQPRIMEVIKLRNSAAADVVNALQTFYTSALAVVASADQGTGFQNYRQTIVLAAEPVTNTVIVSASPEWFPRVMRNIEQLDMQLAQVAVNCILAEVDISNSEEFGVEVGLQSPVLFNRSLVGTSAVTLSNASGGVVPPGTSVTSTANALAFPGFNFNNANNFSQPLPNTNIVSPGAVALQGLSNLGVGRADANGVGGFIFSGASNSVNVLVRALKVQGRIDILNAPTITTLDNQVGEVSVGQIYPYITGALISSLGTITPTITYRTDVGVTLQVTPRINPDGKILMRVQPSIINPIATQISIGNGLMATAFTNQAISTTILADDGETVVIGGLISKQNTRTENKIPFFGDIPFLGALFRYRTQQQAKNELIVILTPRIIRCPADFERWSLDRLKLMDMNMKDVEKVNGKDYLLNPEVGPPKPPLEMLMPGGVIPNHQVPPSQIPPMQMLPQPQPAGPKGATGQNGPPANGPSISDAPPPLPLQRVPPIGNPAPIEIPLPPAPKQ